MKKFRDLVANDPVFILEPLTNNIIKTTVLKANVHPKSLSKKVWVLEMLKISKIESITEEKLRTAKTYDSPVSLQILVDGDATTVILNIPNPKSPIPTITVLSADQEHLTKWINQPGKDTAQMIKELKRLT